MNSILHSNLATHVGSVKCSLTVNKLPTKRGDLDDKTGVLISNAALIESSTKRKSAVQRKSVPRLEDNCKIP